MLSSRSSSASEKAETWVARVALRFVALLERYLPDAFVFALLSTAVVLLAGLWSTGGALSPLLSAWGKGFFSLLPFTLQMALVIITGHLVASAPAVARLLHALSDLPRTPRRAVAFVTLLALLSSWLNWGFSLVFSALLARAVARRFAERGEAVDYRALAAASFLGLGSIWAQGLSGSAALQMATPGAVPETLAQIVACGHARCEGQVLTAAAHGLLPLSHTIFLWQSLVSVVIEIAVVTLLLAWLAPVGAQAQTAAQLGIAIADREPTPAEPATGTEGAASRRPGDFLEHTPWLNVGIVALGSGYLIAYFAAVPRVLEAITLHTVILVLLLLGTALHRTPARLQRAFAEATPSVWGVLLQFPFYGGIAGMLSATQLNERIADLFVGVSSRATLPPLIAIYSAVLGIFVPSGGSKWLIEAPYVLAAAHRLKVHLGWMVAVYDLGEALANLLQPFWMLPTLAILGLSARQVMGYTALVFVVLLPLVLLLTWGLGLTLSYPL
jgi:short-chain fatty acids transporter